jgi:hypothetical protein
MIGDFTVVSDVFHLRRVRPDGSCRFPIFPYGLRHRLKSVPSPPATEKQAINRESQVTNRYSQVTNRESQGTSLELRVTKQKSPTTNH